MNIKIGPYEDWMQPQVAKMFSMQYNVPEQEFVQLMNNFYDHPYQKDRCIRVIAQENDMIIGFQSFFHWPYTWNGKTYNSYQSGNSLVHPDHRGKGLFQKLLNYIDMHREELKIDFLMGFPVEESRKSFLRNNWQNILDLQWYIRFTNPFSLLYPSREQKLKRAFKDEELLLNEHLENFRLSKDKAFAEWRKAYSVANKYYHYTYSSGKATVAFDLKLVKRKTFLYELVIGNIQRTDADEKVMKEALRALRRKAFKCGITFISIAFNPYSRYGLLTALEAQGFRKVNKHIYFIVKPFNEDARLTDPASWSLFRSDIDTW